MKRICLVCTAALLAACGGGGGDAATTMPAPEPAPVTATPGDAFTAALVTLVRSAPDASEPAEVDGTTAILPDGGEPVAVE